MVSSFPGNLIVIEDAIGDHRTATVQIGCIYRSTLFRGLVFAKNAILDHRTGTIYDANRAGKAVILIVKYDHVRIIDELAMRDNGVAMLVALNRRTHRSVTVDCAIHESAVHNPRAAGGALDHGQRSSFHTRDIRMAVQRDAFQYAVERFMAVKHEGWCSSNARQVDFARSGPALGADRNFLSVKMDVTKTNARIRVRIGRDNNRITVRTGC